MSEELEKLTGQEYKYGFVTDIESDTVAKGLNEDVIRFISAKKEEPEWLLEWRLKAFRLWQGMTEPHWAHLQYPPIDYQDISYYSAPKQKTAPKSLDEVDPELLETYAKLGIPLKEQEMLAGVAVHAVFDAVCVATAFKDKLKDMAHERKLQVRGIYGEHSKSADGTFEISNRFRLGYSEVQLVQFMIDGVNELMELENQA